ncbi:MAG: DinB family protein [Euzebyales bacterium]|nr:DinB family protein [Euzebyales bacterium]
MEAFMDVAASVLASYDQTWAQLRDRLANLDDREYLWEPVAGCWTVRGTAEGTQADWADPDPIPAPVTTIAWRTWHIAVDALDSYSRRAFGMSGTGHTGRTWVSSADEAAALLRQAVDSFRTSMGRLDAAALDRRLGASWGDYADHTYLDLLLHAHREMTHHGAEIALLRDLYHARHDA